METHAGVDCSAQLTSDCSGTAPVCKTPTACTEIWTITKPLGLATTGSGGMRAIPHISERGVPVELGVLWSKPRSATAVNAAVAADPNAPRTRSVHPTNLPLHAFKTLQEASARLPFLVSLSWRPSRCTSHWR